MEKDSVSGVSIGSGLVKFEVPNNPKLKEVYFVGNGFFQSFSISQGNKILIESDYEKCELIAKFNYPMSAFTVNQFNHEKLKGRIKITFDPRATSEDIALYRRFLNEQDWDCDWDEDSAVFEEKKNQGLLIKDHSELKFEEWSKTEGNLVFIFKTYSVNPKLILSFKN